MAGTPLQITLYDPDTNEIKQTHSRLFVPWRLLKAAIKMAETLDMANLSEVDVDALAGLVVEAFGNKFSIVELNDGADISEMITVLNMIVAKARGGLPGNPQRPPG